MTDLKKFFDRLTGKKINRISVTAVEPWTNKRTRLSFSLEIESAYLTNVLTLRFKVYDPLVDGEVDQDEFNFLFNKPIFQEQFKEDTYKHYKIKGFGIEPEDFEIEFVKFFDK